eukprot:scaffold45506_cov23-Cyclotella_meneghiniana.AAC.3
MNDGLGKRFPIFTCSHSLSQISAMLDGKHGPSSEQIYATTLRKDKFALESFNGAFFRLKLDPRTSRTKMSLIICQPGGTPRWLDLDVFERDDYEFCKERTSSATDRYTIDTVVKANEICCDAAVFDEIPMRMSKLRQAQSVCPDHCPLAYYMLFEIEAMKLMNTCAGDKGQCAMLSGH